MSQVVANKDVSMETSKKVTGFDTKALVGAVILGVVFVLVQQIAHRIDAIINPASVIIGGVTWATFMGLVVLLFRQPAGIITAEIQAFIALATGLSPLAAFFIPANALGSLGYSLIAWKLPMDKWSHHVLAQIVTNVAGNICVGIGLHVILKLPMPVIIISSCITTLAGIIGGTILTKMIYENVIKSGVLR
ncbi:hypothetical protein HNQ80_002189 [Anaerosolibacter carboniphilus]|uniref:Energy-coupling factor transport system substrate-specific component n=1 Tax=Anaerosolibacter carboniphilus TaxID=1417629 RepID=A0A841KVP9_9FIRM|nr:hypothetical protein [Anaerosolibacter carboniphilus]MBB6216090.1 hypothetical protein [Anaerosolibacter carboniphilus]